MLHLSTSPGSENRPSKAAILAAIEKLDAELEAKGKRLQEHLELVAAADLRYSSAGTLL